jgi:hypothetical protein
MNTKMTQFTVTRPIAFRNQLRDLHHASFIKSSAEQSGLSEQLTRRTDEASQDLFFACMSFVVLLAVAVADVIFHA